MLIVIHVKIAMNNDYNKSKSLVIELKSDKEKC